VADVPAARVIALGQRAAGDDGAGPAVLARLRGLGVAAGVELLEATEASALVEWVLHPGQVVIVDAALGPAPGEVRVLDVEALETAALSAVSSHGLSAGAALALARSIAPGAVSPRIRVVAIGIDPPGRHGEGLSPAIEAAVPIAADAVLRCVAT
jgi:hydrogenase maturation protease